MKTSYYNLIYIYIYKICYIIKKETMKKQNKKKQIKGIKQQQNYKYNNL